MALASSNHQARPSRRERADRLTVDLPAGTLTALKIHVAQRETTIREVVTDLIEREIINEGTHP
ncbi:MULTISPECIES: hypothetical protein [Rhizobiaceae]|uniref:CopG-like ribbon-helix-helix domain-containing protein n=1 Tax=Mycoplana rhizolycopersici TaxID=2746702 RepID=A0ABX2QAI3_9HYPH|nr:MULTISPECIES: hypothetical protein [Rhizobium/Agrobacterium group]NVP54741.1 hypothetical protein [Rhizobium rhizolycopersici]TCV76011.1 hypothetical protein EDE09_101294 [Neorhizobium sp. S3-V5DH]TQN60083.1 hypothetical protein FLX27_17135 [Agrobacterium tumefaciens]